MWKRDCVMVTTRARPTLGQRTTGAVLDEQSCVQREKRVLLQIWNEQRVCVQRERDASNEDLLNGKNVDVAGIIVRAIRRHF